MDLVQHLFSVVAEGRMAKIVTQSNGFRKIFVIVQGSGNGPCYLAYFQGMGKSGPEMISFRSKEDLSLMHQPSEGLGMDYPVPVPLEFGPHFILRLIKSPAFGKGRLAGLGIKHLYLSFFYVFSEKHFIPPWIRSRLRRASSRLLPPKERIPPSHILKTPPARSCRRHVWCKVPVQG